MAERKNPQLDAEHQAILRKMMLRSENRTCADCRGHSPRWASTNLGIFICITCSGIHRKLGTHISQVRSITLDTWTPSQIQHFKKFGNARAAEYFEACLPSDFRRPHSADSMQMERFIRDKYENKRYITIENGGLGGQTVGRNRSSRLAQRPTQNSLGPRPEQAMPVAHQAAYDTTPTIRKTGMSSMSYVGRFSRPVKTYPQQPQRTTVTGKSFTSSTGNASAVQRASTLKQLLTMGFPQDVAVNAVEAGEGDLQRSLDWVLQSDGKSTSQSPAPSTIPPRDVQKDLLDFDEPPASALGSASALASAPAHQPLAPKTVATESLISSTATDSSSKHMTSSGFADFADFGAFHQPLPSVLPSVLPSAISLKQQQNISPLTSTDMAATSTNEALKSSLSNFYKNSPKPTAASSHFQRFPKASSPFQFSISSSQTIGKTRTNEDSLGLTTFDSLSPQNLKLAGKSIPAISLSEQSLHSGTAVPHTLLSTSEPSPPPPPPEHLLFPDPTANQPPPPSPKLDSTANQVPSSKKQGQRHEELQRTDSVSKVEKEEVLPKNDQNGTNEKNEEEEDEDPFAALSMMALSSATKAHRKQKGKKESITPKALETSTSKGAEGTQSSINLDELLS
ncbi:unnamed protein product [Agarophyton chilense]